MATDMTEHYFRNEIKYVTKMLKYHSKETETSNGNPNECLILRKVVDDGNFELVKYTVCTGLITQCNATGVTLILRPPGVGL